MICVDNFNEIPDSSWLSLNRIANSVTSGSDLLWIFAHSLSKFEKRWWNDLLLITHCMDGYFSGLPKSDLAGVPILTLAAFCSGVPGALAAGVSGSRLPSLPIGTL